MFGEVQRMLEGSQGIVGIQRVWWDPKGLVGSKGSWGITRVSWYPKGFGGFQGVVAFQRVLEGSQEFGGIPRDLEGSQRVLRIPGVTVGS